MCHVMLDVKCLVCYRWSLICAGDCSSVGLVHQVNKKIDVVALVSSVFAFLCTVDGRFGFCFHQVW